MTFNSALLLGGRVQVGVGGGEVLVGGQVAVLRHRLAVRYGVDLVLGRGGGPVAPGAGGGGAACAPVRVEVQLVVAAAQDDPGQQAQDQESCFPDVHFPGFFLKSSG